MTKFCLVRIILVINPIDNVSRRFNDFRKKFYDGKTVIQVCPVIEVGFETRVKMNKFKCPQCGCTENFTSKKHSCDQSHR